MDKSTGRFTRYLHDPANPQSIASNKVRALFEDSKGNFWVGTAGDGLHIMNRSTGSFEHFYYNPRDPGKLSRPPLKKLPYYDHISFITEDATGGMWIGTAESGINYYSPRNKRITHYESAKDTAGAFLDNTAWCTWRSREGVIWIGTTHGMLYRVDPLEGSIPFYPVQSNGVTSIYEMPDKTLLIGTNRDGVFHKDASGKALANYRHDPKDSGSLSSNEISSLTIDEKNNMWIGTYNTGLNQFSNEKQKFIRYSHIKKDNTSICHNTIITIYNDPGKYLWVGTFRGLSRLDKSNGQFRNYLFYPDVQDGPGRNVITSVLKDANSQWWIGCWNRGGVQQLDPETGRFKTYLSGASVARILEDHDGIIWAAGNEGLYRLNRKLGLFEKFEDPVFLNESNDISNLQEDNNGNLWMTSGTGIVRLNKERNETTLFGRSYGIDGQDFFNLTAYKGANGKLYFGYQSGYYAFFPDELARGIRAPEIIISAFRVANQLIIPGKDGIIKIAIIRYE